MKHSIGRSRLVTLGAVLLAGALIVGTGCTKKSATETTATDNTESVAMSTSTPGTSTSGTATSGIATSGTVAPSASDQAAAEASLITATDVPAGFSVVESSPSDSSNPLLGIPECEPFQKEIKASDDQRTGRAEVDFKNSDKDEIENQVEVYATEQVAEGAAKSIGDSKYPACLKAAFGKQLSGSLPSGATIDELKVAKADIQSPSNLGLDSAVAYVVDLTVTAQGKTDTLKMGYVALTSGRTLSQLSSFGPAPADLGPVVRAAATSLKANAPS